MPEETNRAQSSTPATQEAGGRDDAALPAAAPPAATPTPAPAAAIGDGAQVTDKQADLVQRAAPAAADPELAQAPRISTILGPLPARIPVKKTRDLNDAVHRILVIGLAVSTVLLVIGVGLGLLEGRQLPGQTLALGEALQRALALRPSGFLSLGLIALMFTPIVRVIGSVVVFIWERDRLYAAVTFFVLLVMTVSVLVGHG